MMKYLLLIVFSCTFLDLRSEIVIGINTSDCALCYQPLFNITKIDKPGIVKVCYPRYVQYLNDIAIRKRLMVPLFEGNANIEVIYNDTLNRKFIENGQSTINWINKNDTIKISIADEIKNIVVDSNSLMPIAITMKSSKFPRTMGRPFVLGYVSGKPLIFDAPNKAIYWPSFSSNSLFSFYQNNTILYQKCMDKINLSDSLVKFTIKILEANNLPKLDIGKVKFKDKRVLALLRCRVIETIDTIARVNVRYFLFRGKIRNKKLDYDIIPIEFNDSLQDQLININYYYDFTYSDTFLALRIAPSSFNEPVRQLLDTVTFPYIGKFNYNELEGKYEFNTFYKASLPRHYVTSGFYYQLANSLLYENGQNIISLFHYCDTITYLNRGKKYSLNSTKEYYTGNIDDYEVYYSNDELEIDGRYAYVLQLDVEKFQYRLIKINLSSNEMVEVNEIEDLDARKTFNYLSENCLVVNKVEGENYYTKMYFW